VNVATSGLYTFQGRFQSAGGAAFHIAVDGSDVTGKISIPTGGKSANWKTISKPNISLSAGKHVLRIFFDSTAGKKRAGNFNWFKFSRS
jgi:hypothetical protein